VAISFPAAGLLLRRGGERGPLGVEHLDDAVQQREEPRAGTELEARRDERRVVDEVPRAVAEHARDRERDLARRELRVQREAEPLRGDADGDRVEPRDLVHHLLLDGGVARAAAPAPLHRVRVVAVGAPAEVGLVRERVVVDADHVGGVAAPGGDREVHDVRVARGGEALGEREGGRERVGVGKVEGRAVGEDAARVPERHGAGAQRVLVERELRDAVREREERVHREREGILRMTPLRLEVVRGEEHPLLPDDAGGEARLQTHEDA
jgi:hypothetical protein